MASTVITGHGYDKIFTSSGIYYIGRKTFLQNYLVTPVLFSTFASNTGSVVFPVLRCYCLFPLVALLNGSHILYPHVPHGTTPHPLSPQESQGDFDPFISRTVRGVFYNSGKNFGIIYRSKFFFESMRYLYNRINF